jgi:hypothetical protein
MDQSSTRGRTAQHCWERAIGVQIGPDMSGQASIIAISTAGSGASSATATTSECTGLTLESPNIVGNPGWSSTSTAVLTVLSNFDPSLNQSRNSRSNQSYSPVVSDCSTSFRFTSLQTLIGRTTPLTSTCLTLHPPLRDDVANLLAQPAHHQRCCLCV